MTSTLPSWCPKYNPLKHDPVTNQEVYCICKKPDEGELMVGCDGCDDWFHFSCLKIPEQYRRLVSSFYCPYCQAGITGTPRASDADPVNGRKTLWKHKCRLEHCFMPCQENSKYCSEEHGVEYMRAVVQGTHHDEDSSKLLRGMIHVSEGDSTKFTELGQGDIHARKVDPQLSPEAYKNIVTTDAGLVGLQNDLKNCENTTIPRAKEQLDTLDAYIAWLADVNAKLNEETGPSAEGEQDADTTNEEKKPRKRKRKASNKRSKVKKSICGYPQSDMALPCTAEEFLQEYNAAQENADSTQTELRGICIKQKCNKHSSWVSIRSDQRQQEVEATEAYRERLELLVRIRQGQLDQLYLEKLNSEHRDSVAAAN